MLVYRTHVRRGKIVLDVPDLPEGAEIHVQVELVEDEGMTDEERRNFIAEQYGLDPAEVTPERERELLDASIRRGIEDAKAGRVIDADQLLEELSGRRDR